MSSSTERVAAVVDHSVHTAYSDPGQYAALLAELPADPEGLSAVARNVIVHYRASGHLLPSATRDDVNSRWVDRILAVDQSRHPQPLAAPREATSRVQGCCRDHTLFCVAALREHGIPARSRVGFAGYFIEGWHHDHVIVEAWLEGRWRRFDPEIDAPMAGLSTPMEMQWDTAHGPGFATAARAWTLHRSGEIDAETYGVDPSVPVVRGERFLFNEIINEVAHRFGDELLLWDGWGRIQAPVDPVGAEDATWADGIATLLLAADSGDLEAEQALFDQYRADPGLHPGRSVLQASPFGDDLTRVALR
ncbi:Transglutaminase-like superfamily protein [Frankineae bacterium MT45]|nr:Transglutaminase-like superfamily protein [Frankineae bacterium MT45]